MRTVVGNGAFMDVKIDRAFKKGVKAHFAGQYAEARSFYGAALKLDAKHLKANFNLGILEVENGTISDAIPFLKFALEGNPEEAQYWISYINALIGLNAPGDAMNVLDQAKQFGATGEAFAQLQRRIEQALEEIKSAKTDPEETMTTTLSPYGDLKNQNAAQFISVVDSLSEGGTNFEKNLDIIDQYLKVQNDDNVKLWLEIKLYSSFLTKYETEHTYNEFFKKIANNYSLPSNYSLPNEVDNGTLDKDKIVFFVHSPVFLAHTNPMFQMIEGRSDAKFEITIASLNHNNSFANRCQEMGISFRVLAGGTLCEKYDDLVTLASGKLALIWMCLPLHLNYVSSRIPNLVWWSHKFHPNIEPIKLRICDHADQSTVIMYNSKPWHKFNSDFEILNHEATPAPWELRRNNFGSFCRENLIDNEEHWLNVSFLLLTGKKLIYFYTGTKPIHQKWCQKLNIDKTRVKFLGWLDEPHLVLKEMMFLIDGPKLGHGIMAFEALSAQVPILSPSTTQGAYPNFLRNSGLLLEKTKNNMALNSIFSDKQGLLQIAERISSEQENNYLANDLCLKLKGYLVPQTFEDFIEIIKNK